jgi:hypothetical protein
MKRIIIICEGQTEQAFCNQVLQPYFADKVNINYPTIKKTGGGIVNWQALKYQIETHLSEDKTAFITTLIDYYGIHKHHGYPFWEEAQKMNDKNLAIAKIEEAMLAEINPISRRMFFPYVQLHEFESLLFSDIDVYNKSFEPDEFLDYQYLLKTIEENENPELINNGSETAPSKRLSKIIKGYHSDNENMKVFYGSALAHDIGLIKIRQKCPRFNNWIQKIENI